MLSKSKRRVISNPLKSQNSYSIALISNHYYKQFRETLRETSDSETVHQIAVKNPIFKKQVIGFNISNLNR